MDFMTAVKTCFGKYVDFSGRASRSEMWFFFLFTWIAAIVAIIIDLVLIGTTALYYIVALGTVLPSLAVHVRRLHDLGKSGWLGKGVKHECVPCGRRRRVCFARCSRIAALWGESVTASF